MGKPAALRQRRRLRLEMFCIVSARRVQTVVTLFVIDSLSNSRYNGNQWDRARQGSSSSRASLAALDRQRQQQERITWLLCVTRHAHFEAHSNFSLRTHSTQHRAMSQRAAKPTPM